MPGALESQDGEVGEEAFAEVLAGKTPEALLSVLTAGGGDPLETFARCTRRARERALLIDPHRLHERALARIALAAASYAGDPPLDEWISASIDRTLEALVNEDREEEQQGARLEEWDARYEFLVYMLGIPPEETRRAAIAFNALREDIRQVWYELCVDGDEPPDVVARHGGDENYVRLCAQACFHAVFLEPVPTVPPPPGPRPSDTQP